MKLILLLALTGSLALGMSCSPLLNRIEQERALQSMRYVKFSAKEIEMLKLSLRAMIAAGYGINSLQEIIRSDMPPEYSGMSLDGGMALAPRAFKSQAFLNHVVEEELLHEMQKLEGKFEAGIKKGSALALEEEVDTRRKFPEPK
jgi:hypothetical protein